MNQMYQFTVPVFVKTLTALDGLLEKAKAFHTERGLEEKALLDMRLAEDMFPFKKQVQIACDNAKGSVARLTGTEIPVHEDKEETIDELRARIKKVLTYIDTISEAQFEGAETRQTTLPYFPGKYMTGLDYAREYALPNFFFHVSIAYAILRKEGATIGKGDFLGGLPLKDL